MINAFLSVVRVLPVALHGFSDANDRKEVELFIFMKYFKISANVYILLLIFNPKELLRRNTFL
jgi:hypothetical protein